MLSREEIEHTHTQRSTFREKNVEKPEKESKT